MTWINLERPGYFGKRRDEIFRQYDEKYGNGCWRISWVWNGSIIDFSFACSLYEDGYYADSLKREKLWVELVNTAYNVIDLDSSDIDSGYDYNIQTNIATHLQDIAIRRVIARRGWKFNGRDLIQIRSSKSYWGTNLSPGRVAFHLSEYIEGPRIKAWWNENSIEDFYQSNKMLQLWKTDSIEDLIVEAKHLSNEYGSVKRKYDSVKGMIGKEVEEIFGRLVPCINMRIGGKAPNITGFDVSMCTVSLELNCQEESLGNQGHIIEEIAGKEMKRRGLPWINVSVPYYYYGK